MPNTARDRPPRWRLILNGKSADDEGVRAAVEAVRGGGIELGVRVTWERGDARRYIDEAIADGATVVVAAGGDGTLGEAAAALAARDDSAAAPTLGLVPLGTANDFATAAQLPVAPGAALALIRDCAAHPIDLLRIDADGERHWCLNLASGGFGTQVTVETDDGLKRMLGGLAYLITGIARLGRIEPSALTLTGPGFEWQGELIALGIGNGRQAGGGQLLCPQALIDDGRLDLTIVPELSGELGTTVATLVAAGRTAALERVAVEARLPWVEIAGRAPLTLNLDGEPVTATRFRADCVPGRVRVHLPAKCPLLDANARRRGPRRPHAQP
jgi:lipid kinase YegS